MTSAAIRQSFLDFFAAHGHTIVSSSSLLPDLPGLLFANAGMNQFVPIFLGEREPGHDTRATGTQKCIRAVGRHNHLEDVGFDTCHHTLFEMLGNRSFGDYFKKESLTWSWELLTKVWGIPPKRLFATVYFPDKAKDDPFDFDQETYDIWAGIFKKAGLDPAVHLVNGNKDHNFWMMDDTGPCGPCSKIHFNLLPNDEEGEGRKLVDSSSPRCIEIWNHAFIQFNANPDGTFSPLAAKYVDTGMGFERIAGIHAATDGFKDFSKDSSNYHADVFASLFKKIAELSGKTYQGTIPANHQGLSEQEKIDVAFRVLADHARCVSCAIADSILPGDEGRKYVIRRILRRGIFYGQKLNLDTGFFAELVRPVVESLGSVFHELTPLQDVIRRVIRSEEESFGRTLDQGLVFYGKNVLDLAGKSAARIAPGEPANYHSTLATGLRLGLERAAQIYDCKLADLELARRHLAELRQSFKVPGSLAFALFDSYGFPLDLTQLLAVENGLAVDIPGFERLVDQQRVRANAGPKKEVAAAATDQKPTKFIGYTQTNANALLVDIVTAGKDTFLVFDQTPFYAEMGGQAGDTGTVLINEKFVHIGDCTKDKFSRHLHRTDSSFVAGDSSFVPGAKAELSVDAGRRRAISRHHSATHLLHWALRKVLGPDVRPVGLRQTSDRLRFDFAQIEAVTHAQLLEVEQLVNEKILDNAKVVTYETQFDKKPEGVLAISGDKYGTTVHVVDIGGYSRELCDGTHVVTTGEIGLMKIVAESAAAKGTRRIEAVAGQAALDFIVAREAVLAAICAHLSASPTDAVKKLESLLGQTPG
jgi:alanyl-tRNA synthetase